MLKAEPVLGLNPTVWLLSGPCCKYFLSDLTGFVRPITAPPKSQASDSQAKSKCIAHPLPTEWKTCSLRPTAAVPRALHPHHPTLARQAKVATHQESWWKSGLRHLEGWGWGQEGEGHLRQDWPREESRNDAVKTTQIQSKSFCGW